MSVPCSMTWPAKVFESLRKAQNRNAIPSGCSLIPPWNVSGENRSRAWKLLIFGWRINFIDRTLKVGKPLVWIFQNWNPIEHRELLYLWPYGLCATSMGEGVRTTMCWPLGGEPCARLESFNKYSKVLRTFDGSIALQRAKSQPSEVTHTSIGTDILSSQCLGARSLS